MVPISRDDSDSLVEERELNEMVGPSIMELHGNASSRTCPRLSPQLAWIHRVITITWLETGKVLKNLRRTILMRRTLGLADRITNDIDYIDSLPKSIQSMEVLGSREFSSLLNHRLMLM